jgi:hypothetical protein
MSTTDIEQPALPPLPGQCFQFPAKDGPVPEIIPIRGYLIEYFYYYPTSLITLSCKGERERFS